MNASTVTVSPSTPNKNRISMPPSKSILHRAIISAALAIGESRITGVTSLSEDIRATIDAIRLLGATIKIDGDELIIKGTGGVFKSEAHRVFCNESGSTLRFLIPVFSLTNNETTFVGSGHLMSRPQTAYSQLFYNKNITFNATPTSIFLHGCLTGGDFVLKGDISSQFITGLLFALPLLKENSTIKIIPPFESRPYVLMTIEVLKQFGVEIELLDENTIFVKGGQKYSACNIKAEGDYSQFAFFGVLGAIKGSVAVEGLSEASVQGDMAILDILSRFGADVVRTNDTVTVSSAPLGGAEVDIADCPDLGPILMVLGAFSNGKTVLKNAGRLKLKESDRIEDMKKELLKLNVNITATDDTVTIEGRKPLDAPATVYSYSDHRIAMSMAVFAACCEQAVTIERANNVNKSYPNFFDDLKAIGVCVDEQ